MAEKEKQEIKNVILAGAIAALVFIISVLFFMYVTYSNAKREIFASMHEIERQSLVMLKQNLEINEKFILSISINLGNLKHELNSDEAMSYLREQNWFADFGTLYLINKEGDMYSGRKSSETEKNYYINLFLRNVFYTDVEVFESETGKYLAITSPVIHDNKVIAILSARFYRNKLNELVTFDMFDGKGHCYLLSKDGSIIARSNNSSVNKDAKTLQELFLSVSGLEERKTYYKTIADGMEKGISGEMIYPSKSGNRAVSFMPMGVSDMYLLTSVPEKVVFSSASGYFFKGIMFVLISIITFAAFMCYFFISMKKNSDIIESANRELYFSKEQFDIVKRLTNVIFFEWDIATGVASHSSNYLDFFNPLESYENFPYSIEGDKTFSQEDARNIIIFFEELKKGLKEGSIEVRVVNKFGKSVWYKASMSNIVNELGNPIKVVGILSDIDEQKRKLQSAEESAKRDPLTQLYNKTCTSDLIQMQIENTCLEGVFLLLDIDNFKGVNDSLGHLYGDAVLSELARSLKSLFRDSDITGRIGGDEFVVFMSGARDLKVIQNKADTILKVFERSFHREGTKQNISCSIGISLYPKDGNTYDELIQKADRALYHAKSRGKNQYTLYSDIPEVESSFEYENTRDFTEIQKANGLVQKNFRENIAEYILKLFYQYEDVDVAVPLLLNFVGESFALGRTDVAVFSEDETYYEVLYEWCNVGVASMKIEGKKLPSDQWSLIKPNLDENNILLCADVEANVPYYLENDDMVRRGVKSVMLSYALEKGKRRAVLSFEYFDAVHVFTREEMDAIRTISNTISLFVLRARERARYLESTAQMKNREMMLDEIDEIVYVSDAENYDLLYLNKTGRDLPGMKGKNYQGLKCHEFLFDSKKPCSFCTMHLLSRDKYYVWENTIESSGQHYMLKDKLLDWDGREARIEWAINLTEKQEQQRKLSSRLKIEKELLEGVGEMVHASNLSESLALVLKRVGHLYKADRSYMMRINEDGKSISMTNEWLLEGIAPEIGNLQDYDFSNSPLWYRAFTMQEPVILTDISKFKESHPEEYERLAVQSILEMYATPITIKGKFWGFLGVDNSRKHRGDMYVLESVAYFVADEISKRNIIEMEKDKEG